jgi:hypothetical protein
MLEVKSEEVKTRQAKQCSETQNREWKPGTGTGALRAKLLKQPSPYSGTEDR